MHHENIPAGGLHGQPSKNVSRLPKVGSQCMTEVVSSLSFPPPPLSAYPCRGTSVLRASFHVRTLQDFGAETGFETKAADNRAVAASA